MPVMEGLIKGLLGGIGQKIYESTDRDRAMEEKGKEAEIAYWTHQLPQVREDPQAREDILGRIFDLYGAHAKKGGLEARDTHKALLPARDFLSKVLNTAYPSGQATPDTQQAVPFDTPGSSESPIGLVNTQTVPGRAEVKGPFLNSTETERRVASQAEATNRWRITQAQAEKAQEAAAEKAAYETKLKRFTELQQPTIDPATGQVTHPGYPVDVAADISGFKGVQRPVDHPETRVVIETIDGRKIEGWQDPYSHKFTDLNNQAVDPTTIKVVNPKLDRLEPGPLGELERAYKTLSNPLSSPEDRKAAKMFTDNYAQGLQNKIDVHVASGTAMEDDQLKALAQYSILTGKDPAFGMGKSEERKRYQAIKADLIAGKGVANAAGEGSEFRAGTATLTDLTKTRGQMRSAENGTITEINRLIELSKRVPRSEIRAFNSLDQFISANLSASPDLARFREALLAARYRYNSMVTSLKSGGVATNQVRAETAEEIINRSMAHGTIEAAADEMKVGIGNIMSGMDKAVDDAKTGLSSIGQDLLPKPKTPGARISVDDAAKYLKANGGDINKAREAAKKDGWTF